MSALSIEYFLMSLENKKIATGELITYFLTLLMDKYKESRKLWYKLIMYCAVIVIGAEVPQSHKIETPWKVIFMDFTAYFILLKCDIIIS